MVRKVFILAAVAMLLPAATAMAFHPGRCEPCHVPHQSDISTTGVPLWSGAQTDTASFTNYEDPAGTMQSDTGDPAGSTLLCLSCHDGASNHSIVHDGGEDGDLSRSHPIEMTYDTDLADADGELVDPADPSPVHPLKTISEDLLAGDKMKCTSCHDVHVSGLHGGVVVAFSTVAGTPQDPYVEYEFTFDDVPHLQNIPGITYKPHHGTSKTDQENYYLRYETLCTTCHIK